MSESFKTDLISAKSRFINPCPKTRSTTAFIPILKILLASLKAFCKVIDLSGKSNSDSPIKMGTGKVAESSKQTESKEDPDDVFDIPPWMRNNKR